MPEIARLTKFFCKIENTYRESFSIRHLIESGEIIPATHSEINFIALVIARLRLDLNHNKRLTAEILEEMLKGAHLRFEDNGFFYSEIVMEFKDRLRKRRSSHQSVLQQYSFSGAVLKEVLFGVTENNEGKRASWIQFERHNTRTIAALTMHLIDYLRYRCTGKNIGPFGVSVYTDREPLTINPVKI
ncbi:hypothetical protein Lqui_0346 [Legionella quinlivanii]|uniref:Uncharacterized protein n=1 Tax=Legionella quinlivanii TaxID=45073 RepID=A0A0W0Y4J9_9GAMM|nr:hypothetical protein [Legionella quinlivanii]KTD51502.1 hypothetical protein Lqui_0346 [Legionella quinlivanii]SEF57200.1 hypothetical protein SAMN02746093_00483 [Legionella quinlivanii DSM 21216]STY10972.1 Uncharacterised protein [Legionella quinlivanii]